MRSVPNRHRRPDVTLGDRRLVLTVVAFDKRWISDENDTIRMLQSPFALQHRL